MSARSFLYGGDSRRGGGGGGSSGFDSDLLTNKSMPLDSFFVSGSSHSFAGSRSMVSFEDRGNGSKRAFFQSFDQEDNGDDEYDDYFQNPEKKRRLKVDQVQFLEKSFEADNKLEPERKIQLAKDLGLQPRQVAIWFQNRRARWKTKNLEKDFDVLQESYNELKANYENLLQEKEKLKSEVLDLSDKLLMQETEKGTSDSSTTKSPFQPLQQEHVTEFVNDDIAVKSVVSESSYLFEQDQSDESLSEEDNFGKLFVNPDDDYMLQKNENGDYHVNSCYLGFTSHDQEQEQDRDQDFGFWSY